MSIISNKHQCACIICRRGREIQRIAKLLPAEDAEILNGIFNGVLDDDEERDMREALIVELLDTLSEHCETGTPVPLDRLAQELAEIMPSLPVST